MLRRFGGIVTNELWEGGKWKALLPVTHRNQPAQSSGLRSGVVAVVLKEVIAPVSADLEQQWLYVETYNPLEQQLKEAIVQASTLATWSKRGTSAKKRCYFKGEDRGLPNCKKTPLQAESLKTRPLSKMKRAQSQTSKR